MIVFAILLLIIGLSKVLGAFRSIDVDISNFPEIKNKMKNLPIKLDISFLTKIARAAMIFEGSICIICALFIIIF